MQPNPVLRRQSGRHTLVPLRTARLAFLGLAVITITAYYMIPSARPAATGLAGVVGVAAIAAGLAALRPQRWRGWVFLAAAVALLTAADVANSITAIRTAGSVPFPGPASIFALLAYLPLTVGLLVLGQPGVPSRDWPLLLDTATLSLAGYLVLWLLLIEPAMDSTNLSGAGAIIAVAGGFGYVAVLAAAVRVFIASRANLSLALLTAAVITFLANHVRYGAALLAANLTTGGVKPGFLAFDLLCGAAALTRSMAQTATPTLAGYGLGPRRLCILAISLLVAPTALLVQATSGAVTDALAIAFVTATIGMLMLSRLYLTAQAQHRRGRRERAVRDTSRDLVLVDTQDQVVDSVARAIATMLPPPIISTVHLLGQPFPRITHGRDRPPRRRTAVLPLTADSRPDDDTGRGLVETTTAGATRTQLRPALIVRASAADLAELEPAMRGLADQASSAINHIRLLAKLRAEERERYFRTLVLTSDDVTLISRGGVVTYATPSAQAMFGHDISGQSVDELIQRPQAPPQWWTTTTGADALIQQDGRDLVAWVRSRDLHDDPTIGGVVTTLHDITAERRLQADLAYRASHDLLTGLANAQSFKDHLSADDRSPADRRDYPQPGRAALFIDIDDFKTVNDTYGHRFGDQLLTEVARRIQACLRADDLAARLGGDEFAVVLRQVDDLVAAHAVAQRIADALATPAVIADHLIDCQASIGVSYTAGPGDTDTLLRQADIALYNAKAAGKGQWRQYHDGMAAPARQLIEYRHRLEDALRDGRLSLHYQPIVELHTADPVGFEALLRLRDDSPMAPEQIITVAEETGLMSSLGAWILEQALAALPVLNPAGTANPRYVSVNVSARQLRQADFVDTVRDRVAETHADPAHLVLEVSENLLAADDIDPVWTKLTDLRHDGIRIALDDFPTGYAAVGAVHHDVFDIIKIDKIFLCDPTDRRFAILLKAIQGACQQLNIDLVVEGVETIACRRLATDAGVQYGQGFHYTPALPLDDAAAWRFAGEDPHRPPLS
jgi:diguanylate cyclase (GGDEF)-like protein